MSDTLETSTDVVRDTTLRLNWEFYTQQAKARGARRAEARRELTGLSRSTENRWRRGKGIRLEKAHEMAQKLDTPWAKLFVEVKA